MIKKKSRKTILKKRDKKLDTIGYSKLDIMWFFQWLKLAVDMQGQSLSFTKSNWVTGSQNKQVRKPTTKSFKITVGGIGLSAINLNEFKRLINQLAAPTIPVKPPKRVSLPTYHSCVCLRQRQK